MLRHASDPVRAVLLAAALFVAYLTSRELATLLITLVITLIITLPLARAADAAERHHLPRALGAVLALLLGLSVVGGIIALVVPAFVEQGERFVDQIPSTIDLVERRISDLTGSEPAAVGASIQDAVQRFTDEPGRLVGPIASIGLGALGLLATLVVVLLTAVYLAINPRPIVDGFLSLFPQRRRAVAAATMMQIRAAWIGWLRGVGIDMLVSGTLLYLGLLLVGLDFAVVFAVVSALFVVIPYFGAFAGGLPPVIFALADSPTKALLVLVIYAAVQQIEGNVIVPLVMSRQVKLHPASIIVGVTIVQQVLGLVGLIVAVPIIAATLILVRVLWIEPMQHSDEHRVAPPDVAGLGDATGARTVTTTTGALR